MFLGSASGARSPNNNLLRQLTLEPGNSALRIVYLLPRLGPRPVWPSAANLASRCGPAERWGPGRSWGARPSKHSDYRRLAPGRRHRASGPPSLPDRFSRDEGLATVSQRNQPSGGPRLGSRGCPGHRGTASSDGRGESTGGGVGRVEPRGWAVWLADDPAGEAIRPCGGRVVGRQRALPPARDCAGPPHSDQPGGCANRSSARPSRVPP